MKNKAIGFSFMAIWLLGLFFALIQFPDVESYWFFVDGSLVFSALSAFLAVIEWNK